MTQKILFVDDEPAILDSFRMLLRRKFDVYTAEGPVAGLKAVQGPEPFAVVVSDLKMPDMDGVTFLTRVRELSPDTVRLMLTGFADVNVATEAVNAGQVFRFLTKPCPPEVLVPALTAALEQHRLVMAEKELLRGTLRGSVQVLTEALSLANPEAYGRALRIRTLARKLAKAASVPMTWELDLAAMLSHLGCMALPRTLLEKIGAGQELTDDEQRLYDSHPAVGEGLLKHIPRFEHVAELIGRQQERHDAAVCAEKDLGARVLKVASDYDLLQSRGLPGAEIMRRMNACEGCYDPGVLAALATAVGGEADHVLRRVRLDELREDMVLEEGIYSDQGLLLLAKGSELNKTNLQRMADARQRFTIVEPILVRMAA